MLVVVFVYWCLCIVVVCSLIAVGVVACARCLSFVCVVCVCSCGSLLDVVVGCWLVGWLLLLVCVDSWLLLLLCCCCG